MLQGYPEFWSILTNVQGVIWLIKVGVGWWVWTVNVFCIGMTDSPFHLITPKYAINEIKHDVTSQVHSSLSTLVFSIEIII